MATIVNNPPPVQRPSTTYVETDSSVGWAVAIIILLLVVAGGVYLWTHTARTTAPTDTNQQPGATVNVTLPAGTTNDSGTNTGTNSGTNPETNSAQ